MTTSIKTCFKCGIEKALDEFYKHKAMSDGYLGKCKECTKNDTRSARRRRIDHYRDYDRKRGSRRTTEDLRAYRRNNPTKNRAHRAVSYALSVAKLHRQPCEVCGREDSHAHHDDYSKPFDVRWLCPPHHQQWHAQHGEGLNAA